MDSTYSREIENSGDVNAFGERNTVLGIVAKGNSVIQHVNQQFIQGDNIQQSFQGIGLLKTRK